MNIIEDESNESNEQNHLNNYSESYESSLNSNFPRNNNTDNSINLVKRIKIFVKVLLKNYLKIIGIIFMLVFLYIFVEFGYKNNPIMFYLEKGAECLENYFSSIDKIMINIKSSSQGSVRRLNDAFFREEIVEENENEMEISKIANDTKDVDENENLISNGDKIDFKYYKLYEFTKNITNLPYKGKWQFLKTNVNSFSKSEGDVEFEIIKNFTYMSNKNFITNIEAIKSLYFYAILKNGPYRDNIILTNFTLSYPVNFSENFLTDKNEDNKTNNKIILTNSKISLSYYQQEILDNPIEYECDDTTVDVEFIRDPKILMKDFEEMSIAEYSKINLRIRDESCNFSVDLYLEIDDDDDFSDRIWNYSLLTTFISILEICFILKLIHEVAENNQVGKNLCLITISINIIWNAFMCTAHFYLSMINEESSYEYGTPSMTYFLLFSFFELRLLFFAWKSRYAHLIYENNLVLYRKELLRFYSIFYFFLFISLLFMRYFFTNFFTSLFFFSLTWIFQIIHSTVNGTKPPFSMNYIYVISLGKLFTPLYLKACPFNIFELKPEYGKMLIITLIVLLQIGILAIQKHISPKFLLPKFLKKQPYNFYKELNEQDIINNKLNNECIICLEMLLKPQEDLINQSNTLNVQDSHGILFYSYNKIINKITVWCESLKYAHNKKSFMVTPCNHAFHTPCFEKWIEMKNECPYCRRSIPPLE